MMIDLKRDILIINTWNEYIKNSDGMFNLSFYRKFHVKMLFIWNVSEIQWILFFLRNS